MPIYFNGFNEKKILRKKISNLALILKANILNLNINGIVFKHFQFGLNIKSQFFKLNKYWTVFKHFQFVHNIKSQF